MSNFQFLLPEWESLHQYLSLAEKRVHTEPVSSAQYGRIALEECVQTIYGLEYLEIPYNNSLASMLQQPEFKAVVPDHLLRGVSDYTRKTGNRGSHHGNKVSNKEALISLRYLYDFVKWFAQNYSEAEPILPGRFDETLIPKTDESIRKLAEIQAELAQVQAEAERELAAERKARQAVEEAAKESEAAAAAYQQQIAAQQELLKARKASRPADKLTTEFTEKETRQHFIDVALKEAGWETLRQGYEIEYPVTGMPITRDNPRGNGFVDYVLWGENGLPLALIEAKRTGKSEETGLHQARLYADCLEKMHGQRPVIFVSNGLRTQILDDTFYSAPRKVHGFYTRDDLEWLVQKRATREDIRLAEVTPEIAGRGYQQEGIRRIMESFVVDAADGSGLRGRKRTALMVMATGAGKTRTSAAMVEVLLKKGWAKRVLFLADRNALVSQAKRSFSEQLPNYTAIDLTKEKEDQSTRLVFSTYPTMMNQIDSARSDGNDRLFGVGHFDLIIIDEAHRSVYDRYQAIFAYFDAMVVGLTATPIDFIDKSTFDLFECPSNDPTFHYSLDEAVAGGFLVPSVNLNVPTKFMRDGIAYHQLSDKEKEAYEETFRDDATGLFPEQIRNSAMNKWLFNKDTAFKVLDRLMEEGLKIEGGDKIGRTIIFAVNQKHAEFVVSCFRERYPEYSADFVQVVHNAVSHSQSIIEAFCDHHIEKMPQITVSVDMMDTGVDAPRVLNLVFFKVVRSRAKFEQMIGRGTRLCPDVFGPEQPKEEFYIFDVCGNFDFFDIQKKEREVNRILPLSQQIFINRLEVSQLLMGTGEDQDRDLAEQYRNVLHKAISTLDERRFQVQGRRALVDKYSAREAWNYISQETAHEIITEISHLPEAEKDNETARRFDLLMLKLQMARLMLDARDKVYCNNLIEIANRLGDGTRYGIPEVARAKPLIEEMKEPEFYEDLSQPQLEELRIEIRNLVQYLQGEKKPPVYTNLEDEIGETEAREREVIFTPQAYKRRVERFIREHKTHLTIRKLNSNEPITETEVRELERLLFEESGLGDREAFEKAYGEEPLGKFIRGIVGLSVEAAQAAFGEFLQSGSLSADQIRFIQMIIDHLSKNGTIDKQMLFQSPFNDQHQDGPIGIFDEAQIFQLVSILDEVNRNAGVG